VDLLTLVGDVEDRRSGGDLLGDADERILLDGDIDHRVPTVGDHVVDHRPVRLVECGVARAGLDIGDDVLHRWLDIVRRRGDECLDRRTHHRWVLGV